LFKQRATEISVTPHNQFGNVAAMASKWVGLAIESFRYGTRGRASRELAVDLTTLGMKANGACLHDKMDIKTRWVLTQISGRSGQFTGGLKITPKVFDRFNSVRRKNSVLFCQALKLAV
jgi:hypothetical protein